MDFAILMLAARFLKLTYRIWRLLLGSAVGALGACVVLAYQPLPAFIRFVLAYVVTAILMILISYGWVKRNKLLYILLVLYGQTIFLGGILQVLLGNSSLQDYMCQVLGIRSKNGVSIFAVMVLVILLLALSPLVYRYIYAFRSRVKNVYHVTLQLEDRSIAVSGLLDTGNHLREPISNKPVIIVEQKVIEEILTKNLLDYHTRIKIVPYKSIGKEQGTLLAIALDEITVEMNDERHVHKNVIACLYKGTLSTRKDYQVILHEELI